MDPVSRGTPAAPDEARRVFASRLPLAERYAELLATEGIVRGLIGPREAPRLWERHLLNGPLLTDLVEDSATVADLGSGAGLPGILLAVRRPDLQVTLVEPLLRRTTFLEEVVADLGLPNVEVVRGRAEELAGERTFDVVTSRALAPLPRLLSWSLPLVASGGQVLALKGSSAAAELASVAVDVARLGGSDAQVSEIGEGIAALTVVRVRRAASAPVASETEPGGSRRGGRDARGRRSGPPPSYRSRRT